MSGVLESQRMQLRNPVLAVKLGSGLWRRVLMPCCVCLHLLVPKNASRRENEIGNQQLSYDQDGKKCLHALEVAQYELGIIFSPQGELYDRPAQPKTRHRTPARGYAWHQ